MERDVHPSAFILDIYLNAERLQLFHHSILNIVKAAQEEYASFSWR